MDHQLSNAAPGAGSTIKFVASRVWRFKWLIGGLTLAAAIVVFALPQASTDQIWTGRTVLRIGLMPTAEYILETPGAPTTAIEAPRNVAARISDYLFKAEVVSHAAFEPATAAISKPMVSSSLRGIVLEGDRDVAVELSAGSSADVKAAFRAVAAEIDRVHGEILNRQLKYLQGWIDEAKGRIAVIEQSSERLNDRVLGTTAEDKTAARAITAPVPAASIPAWNELKDRIQRDTNLKELAEPSALRLDGEISMQARSIGTLRSSLLAGFAMLLAMIVLTIVISSPSRGSST